MSFIAELKRRNVFRVAVFYVLVGWITMQIADTMFPALNLPDWTIRFVAGLLLLGFPVALVLAWALELTPDGIKLQKEVDRSNSITPQTGRKLDFAIIGVLLVVVAYFAIDKFVLTGDEQAAITVAENETATETLERSVAVLPFTNRSAEEEDAYFTDGIHDDLLTQLSKIGDLKVISRTSVMQYRDTTKTMREIGRELGVATILEGGVQRAGTTVRINAQLIDAETDEHLWAETFDRELSVENLLAIQSDISRAIAAALEAQLNEEEEQALADIPTTSLEAYELYLQAISLGWEGLIDFHVPDRLLARALALDPDFMLAAIARVELYLDQYWFITRDPAHRQRASDMLDAIHDRAQHLPEYHHARAQLFYHGFLDYENALKELAKAERGLPNSANLWNTKAAIKRRQGHFEESAELFKRARELAPNDVFITNEIVTTCHALKDRSCVEKWLPVLGERDRFVDTPAVFGTPEWQRYLVYGHAEALADKYEEVFHNTTPPELLVFTFVLAETGRWEQALESLDYWESDIQFNQGVFFTRDSMRGLILWYQGEREAARPLLEKGLEQVDAWEAANGPDYRSERLRAILLAHLGQREAAIAAAERSIADYPMEIDVFSGTRVRRVLPEVYAALGEHDRAMQELRAYLELPGSVSLQNAMNPVSMKSLREHPDFPALEAEFSFPEPGQ